MARLELAFWRLLVVVPSSPTVALNHAVGFGGHFVSCPVFACPVFAVRGVVHRGGVVVSLCGAVSLSVSGAVFGAVFSAVV